MSKGFGIKKSKKKLKSVVPIMPEYQENFDRFVNAVRLRDSEEFYWCVSYLVNQQVSSEMHIKEICRVLGAVTRDMSTAITEDYRLWVRKQIDETLARLEKDIAAFRSELNLD